MYVSQSISVSVETRSFLCPGCHKESERRLTSYEADYEQCQKRVSEKHEEGRIPVVRGVKQQVVPKSLDPPGSCCGHHG